MLIINLNKILFFFKIQNTSLSFNSKIFKMFIFFFRYICFGVIINNCASTTKISPIFHFPFLCLQNLKSLKLSSLVLFCSIYYILAIINKPIIQIIPHNISSHRQEKEFLDMVGCKGKFIFLQFITHFQRGSTTLHFNISQTNSECFVRYVLSSKAKLN